jgi:RNA polymerase sigma-70 factor (ECF subfamily)
MDADHVLAERFEADRARLRALAYRMLGSASEAEDAVQEAWLRLSRADAGRVENLSGWLTTVVGRVCLDMLRSRKARREEPHGEHQPDQMVATGPGADPEREALLADSVGMAMLVVLDTLGPAERVAFVLHDMFAVPFGEIGMILDRSPEAAKQLASRARRRVQGADASAGGDPGAQRRIVSAFLAAARDGDFQELLAVLAPDVVVRADAAAVALGAAAEVRGAAPVVATFGGRARGAKLALVDQVAGAAWAPGGRPRVVFSFTIADGKIAAIDLIGDRARLAAIELVLLET